MQPLSKRAQELFESIQSAYNQLSIDSKLTQKNQLSDELADPDVWSDQQSAQIKSKQLAELTQLTDPWIAIMNKANDLKELLEMGDASLQAELDSQIIALEDEFEKNRKILRFNGPYDLRSALVRLSAGAGGTDAQDWTEMLERMYIRWAENHGIKTSILERSPGEEAGVKTSVIQFDEPFSYGKLKSEHGVHRLVRLSPFNSDNLRQTSFALVEVLPQIDTPEEVAIDDKDLKIDVFRSGGSGGQSVNTTDSAVRVTHIPTGIVASIQNERSQLQNKETALNIVRSKLAQLKLEQHEDDLAKIKGPSKSAEWGSQIRNYVLHPYTMVKDTRTKYEQRDAASVLDGKIDGFIDAYLDLHIA